MRSLLFVLAGAVLAVTLLAVASPTSAGSSHAPVAIDVDRTIDGADTYLFSIRINESEGDPSKFEIANDSHFRVKGHYAVNGSPARQDAAAIQGVIQYQHGLDCPPASGGWDPCFMSGSGVSKKDTWDARATAGPLTVENDPNYWGWEAANTGIDWWENRTFEIPNDADQLTIRFFISIPDAERIDVDVHIHSPQNISIRDEVVSDGGFYATGEDFQPAASADTAPTSAMVDGRATVQHPDNGDRLFASFGPSWNGATASGFVAARHNTAAVSNIAYEDPAGDRTSGIAYGLGGPGGILIPGSEQAGTHIFDVNAHAGLGPQDIYLVGYQGPIG